MPEMINELKSLPTRVARIEEVLGLAEEPSDGVWIVWAFNDGPDIYSVHRHEIQARRACDDWRKVMFLAYGKDFSEAVRER